MVGVMIGNAAESGKCGNGNLFRIIPSQTTGCSGWTEHFKQLFSFIPLGWRA